jgi:isopenicillin N synthase-like dioxygenase
MKGIPVLDRCWSVTRFDDEFGRALESCGFAVVVNHGIIKELITSAYRAAVQLFALPLEVKQKCETPENGRQTGYTSLGVEHAKDQTVGDLKEFWHVMRPGCRHPEKFPPEASEFKGALLALFGALEICSGQLLRSIGRHLEFPAGTFDEMTRSGDSVLRILHYPDVEGETTALRAAPHEDINLLTLLVPDTNQGLEVLGPDGAWIPVSCPPSGIVVNGADMLQLYTGGRIRSATHRVVNPEKKDGGRYSMPFFTHPRPEILLTTNPPFTAGEYLQQRLREIGVIN